MEGPQKTLRQRDRCGKLLCWQGPDFPQAGHGFAPGNLFVKADPDSADETLGSPGGPFELGIDEVSGRLDDDCWVRLDPAGRFFDLHLVTQSLGYFNVPFEQQQQVV